MNKASIIFRTIGIGVVLSLISCTTSKREKQESGSASLMEWMKPDAPIPEETVESLLAIANAPNSKLPAEDRNEVTANSTEETTPESGGVDLIATWSKPGINPLEVNPGDIFFENAGPVLHKSLSLVDELPNDERITMLTQFTASQNSRVPITLSRAEIDRLHAQNGAVALPTRSVALDLRTSRRVVDVNRLEPIFEALQQGNSPGVALSEARGKILKSQLEAVKKQLQSGEKLFIVTSVVESEKLIGTYPGAPVGAKDADLIRNAVQTLHPHLVTLEAAKEGNAISLSADPRLLWEFETREVKLIDGKLTVDEESVVQL